jgi:hypothetical protein
MEYQLFERDNPGSAVVKFSAEDSVLAGMRALDWVRKEGKPQDYALKSAGGEYSAHLFQTVGGDWYIMRA